MTETVQSAAGQGSQSTATGFAGWRRLAVILTVLAASIACDRATKQVAEKSLAGVGRLSYLGDIFRFEYVENRGAFLSLGANLPDGMRGPLLTGGVAVVLLVVLAAAFLGRRSRAEVAALALLASGGLGNLWDRVARGGTVVDFMNLGIGPVRTGIFNVADLAIMGGLAMLLLLGRRQRAPAPAAGAPPPPPPQGGAPTG